MTPESGPAMTAEQYDEFESVVSGGEKSKAKEPKISIRDLRPGIAKDAYRNLSVLGLVADDTACGRYRVIHPFEYLNKYGARCEYRRAASLGDMLDFDVIIAQRQYSDDVAENMLFEAQRLGKLVFYEVDDNLHQVLPTSPVFGIYHQGSKQLNTVSKILSRVDGLTVSTAELAADYSSFNNNIEVLPNSIDFGIRDWETRPTDKDPNTLVVGWAGGTTHWEDLQLLRDVIPQILDKYDFVKFGLYSSNQLVTMLIEHWGLDPDRVEFIAPRTFDEYPGGLPYIDIGLAPVVRCRFNAAKSNLKILEYGAWGIPSVASVVPPYSTTIRNGVNGYTANTPGEWVDRVSDLVENEAGRWRQGETMKATVKSDFDMGVNVHLWPQAWKRMAERAGTKARVEAPVAFGSVGRNAPCPCGSGEKYKKCECYPAWGR